MTEGSGDRGQAAETATSSGWSGFRRNLKTRASVRRAEIISSTLITIGGFGTILAVLTIFGFLLSVIVPLFQGGQMAPDGDAPVALAGTAPVIHAEVDDKRLLSCVVRSDGTLTVTRLKDGSLVEASTPLFGGREPTSHSFSPGGHDVAFGFADGTIQRGTLRFTSTYFERDKVPEALRHLAPGEIAPHPEGAYLVTPENQFRLQRLSVAFGEPLKAGDTAIDLLDLAVTTQGKAFGALTRDGRLWQFTERSKYDIMQDREITKLVKRELPYEVPADPADAPQHLLLSGTGFKLYLIARNGTSRRYDLRPGRPPMLMEEFDVTPDDALVTRVRYLLGKTTLLVGDNRGLVRAWFPTRAADAYASDGEVTTPVHELAGHGVAVRSLAGSQRGRTIAVGYDDGTLNVFYVTTTNRISAARMQQEVPVQALAIAPKQDELIAFGPGSYERFHLDIAHPEATLASLFSKVWYEGNDEPAHVWQSSGSDDFEPKLGMMPLIFGTLKGTIYSMLIAAPIALLAAVYTSEFLTPRARAPIKSVIEMMAGLPSVVLGFLAALVIAPFVQQALVPTLVCLATVPFAFILGARLWQFMPGTAAIRLEGVPKVLFILAGLGVGVAFGAWIGPWVERTFFAGSMRDWLHGGAGDAVGGWAFVLLPAAALVVVLAIGRFVSPWLRSVSLTWSTQECAVADLVKLAGGALLTIGLAFGIGALLSASGADPRGDALFGPHSQRNALIVGFVMGFAVIPIIYTLAEDALSSVPHQLREGSLGAGATQWQTAWRIVIPTAMSGLFSALMVGLGRSVGETMIVLMATGNTPIMEMNMFNGFRTLSANIAVELPEAAKGDTHYRTLFLAAFVLFVMTFLINTVAEQVRRTFRKRAAQL